MSTVTISYQHNNKETVELDDRTIPICLALVRNTMYILWYRGVVAFSSVPTDMVCKKRDLDPNYLIEVYSFDFIMWFVIESVVVSSMNVMKSNGNGKVSIQSM
jgi:hypothetical protein